MLASLTLDSFGLLGLTAKSLDAATLFGTLAVVLGAGGIVLGQPGTSWAQQLRQIEGKLGWIALALVAGAVLPVQGAVNALLRADLGAPFVVGTVSFLVATLAMVAVQLVISTVKDAPKSPAGGVTQMPWWGWLGGFAGATYVTTMFTAIPVIGTAAAVGLTVAGQQVASVFVDRYGWFRLPKRPVLGAPGECRFVTDRRHADSIILKRNRHDYALYGRHAKRSKGSVIMLREVALPHTVRAIDLGKGEQHAPEFVALSPNHKIPAIVDSDTGRVLFESGAILIYLADKSGLFLTADPAGRSVALQWLFMQVGHVGPMLGQLWWFRHGTREPNPQALERYTRETNRLYGVIERRLGETRFIAGDEYSIADIAMFPWLRTHEELAIDIDSYSHVKAWLEQIGPRPAVVQGLRVPESTHRD